MIVLEPTDHFHLVAVVLRCRRVLAATRNLEVAGFAWSEGSGQIGRVLIDELAVVEQVGFDMHAPRRLRSGVLCASDDGRDAIVFLFLDIGENNFLRSSLEARGDVTG